MTGTPDQLGIDLVLRHCPELRAPWEVGRDSSGASSVDDGSLIDLFWTSVIGPYLQHALPSEEDMGGSWSWTMFSEVFAMREQWSNLPPRGSELDELTGRLFQSLEEWTSDASSNLALCAYGHLCDEPPAGVPRENLLGFAGPAFRSLTLKASLNASIWQDALSEREMQIAGACLRAAANGPFFPDWEFSTLFGFERSEIETLAEAWPNATDASQQRRAVQASMNNLSHYPHHLDSEWASWVLDSEWANRVPASRAEVTELLHKIARPAIPS